MIRRKTQEDATGCGLACVAMLGGIGYAQARVLARRLGVGPHDRVVGRGDQARTVRNAYFSDARQLRRMLKLLGLRAGPERRLARWEALDRSGIAGINPNRREGSWHWVVYLHSDEGGCVLDPNPRVRSERRTDFGRMKPRCFIPVAPA
ncbi:hypothetical protein [Lysobacter sp. ESA13C]|uniref:hypothetical protein n=1 Tax=Lysobacter sp. ESA13C TaxID=2862676 RepID=UPI001CBD54C2|nr:hypothetical protein [Lysobacter sp. ESA13C]